MNGLHTVLYTLFAVLFYKNTVVNLSAKGNQITLGNDTSKFAGKIENHQLLVDIVENTTVESELDCMLKCMREKECLSFDTSLGEKVPYLLKCYLLSSDHNDHSNLLVARQGYDHYYFENENYLPAFFANQGKSDEMSNGVSRCVITTSDPSNHIHDNNWTVVTSGGVDGANVELRGTAPTDSHDQFIVHTPGLDPSTGNVSFELDGHPRHYVVAVNDYLIIKAYEDTAEFKTKATFTRHVIPSKPGYETFMFQGLTVYNNPGSSPELQYKKEILPIVGDIYWFKIVN
ncbi:uncharacterized protein LOC116293567 [Actinia tenebrosa]|uniref:Uncharacterized protein LOC116293567 n=1 Tax=Actinia tenebrosa TaxID=6105 RepID=A0A6P8HWB5_ACTTE|nr:uncharacterized protein LOC116293567 [Actinia tenebrosa]